MKPDREAGNGDSTWEHRWGFADTRFMLNQDGSVTLTGDRYDMAGYGCTTSSLMWKKC